MTKQETVPVVQAEMADVARILAGQGQRLRRLYGRLRQIPEYKRVQKNVEAGDDHAIGLAWWIAGGAEEAATAVSDHAAQLEKEARLTEADIRTRERERRALTRKMAAKKRQKAREGRKAQRREEALLCAAKREAKGIQKRVRDLRAAVQDCTSMPGWYVQDDLESIDRALAQLGKPAVSLVKAPATTKQQQE